MDLDWEYKQTKYNYFIWKRSGYVKKLGYNYQSYNEGGCFSMKQKYKSKKFFLGILTAAVTINSSLTTFASIPRTNVSSKATGESEGLVPSTDVFNVVLPAVPDKTIIYDFILDPKNMAPSEHPDDIFEDGASLYFKNEDSNYSHKSDVLTIQNKSTMKVDVKLNANISGMDNVIMTSDDTFTNDTNASVYLALEDSNNKLASVDKYGAFLRATLDGRKDAYKIIYDPTTDSYKYGLKSDDELKAENITFADYSFNLSGACNQANEWLNLPIAPEVMITWTVAPRPENLAPSIGKTFYSMTENKANTVYVDLGSGNLAATDIQSITYINSAGTTTALTDNDYTFSDETLLFNASYVTSLIKNGIRSREYKITFNDNASTQVTVTLTANDISPVIEDGTYNIQTDTEVLVKVDLGSGNLAATGIKSITYTNSTGAISTLPSDKYSLINGVLRFKPSFINSLLSAGIIQRSFTITLNDKAETTATINLIADGVAPSISENSYEILRDTAIPINVNLGSGDLAATGIQAISYTNSAGKTTLLDTSNYTFVNDTLTFNAPYITSLVNAGIASRDYTIVFDNIVETQITITLTARDDTPSIIESTYYMHNDQAILVPIDFGSGNSGATGIKSITYINSTGAVTTLPTDKYSIEDGQLRFKVSFINSLISAGIIQRDYTITLNDTAKTTGIISLAINGMAPSIAVTSYEMLRNTAIPITVDLGSNDLAATGISSITYTNSSGILSTLGPENYSFINNTLTLNAPYITSLINAGNTSRKYMITFNNVVKTSLPITLTAQNIEPSIPTTSYIMHKDQDILVDVDLGSGNLGASDIKSITYQNSAGVTTTLPTDKYTFTDGTLRFKVSFINSLLSAGILKRDYLIYFNNNAGPITITLTANGTFPSIATTSYSIVKNQAVPITVNLGSGDLGATGIQSITYVNSAGMDTTLAPANYTLTGGTLIFNASFITNLINGGISSRGYTIIFNDIAKTQKKISLNVKDIAPSFAQATSYSMVKDQPILINIDLGAGNLKASGIQSITYTNSSGKAAILASSNYTFTDGVLRIKAFYISGLLDAKVPSRSYTIILNDTAKTQKTIVFKA